MVLRRDGRFNFHRQSDLNFRGYQGLLSAIRPPKMHSLSKVKHVGYKDLKEVCADLKKIYTASSAEIGSQNLNDFADK